MYLNNAAVCHFESAGETVLHFAKCHSEKPPVIRSSLLRRMKGAEESLLIISIDCVARPEILRGVYPERSEGPRMTCAVKSMV
jgi:hypothetical protein